MTNEQRLKNLKCPTGIVDVVLDTDAYNEIDDQYAIAYLLRNADKLNTVAIYAAPFYNDNSTSPEDGMEKSYNEIFNILSLLGEERPVFRGSKAYLPDEKTPVISDAAQDLASRAENYSPENPLYVVAIGAITNVASAILINPKVAENTVVVWLGGHARHYAHTKEFNMYQDILASRVVMESGVPFVQVPCMGVVDAFRLSKPEMCEYFMGKSPIGDYLAKHSIEEAERYAKGAWTRVIWDLCAVAWLVGDDKFTLTRVVDMEVSDDEGYYRPSKTGYPMAYVYSIKCDELLNDLIEKII